MTRSPFQCQTPGLRTTVLRVSLVEHTPRAGVIWSGATHVRARPWPTVPGRAFLLITGSHGPDIRLPDQAVLTTWLATLSSWGYDSVRTSALAPAAASAFIDIGFTVVQELSLLERSHSGHSAVSSPETSTITSLRITPFSRSLKNSSIAELLSVDLAAFGPEWAMDEETLREALSATKRVRLFVWRSHERIDGFVLAGATGNQGFVQRLAVHPDSQREGIATQLLEAAIAWTQRCGCRSTVVNTEISNTAALGAYHRFGFTQMDYGLSVLEIQFHQ